MHEAEPPTPPSLAPPQAGHITQQKGQLVQFEGFRCMAYVDEFGKWRASFSGKELTGFLRIVDF
jgi:hypothetical protein